MKFGQQFEFHKIPEWYNMYLDYDLLCRYISEFKDSTEHKKSVKLAGYYILTKNNAVVNLKDGITEDYQQLFKNIAQNQLDSSLPSFNE